MVVLKLSILLILLKLCQSTVYFHEEFLEPDFSKRWIQSEYTGKEFGKFIWSSGKFYGDDLKDKGLKTTEDARFYAISAKFEDNKFTNEGKPLVIQFSGT